MRCDPVTTSLDLAAMIEASLAASSAAHFNPLSMPPTTAFHTSHSGSAEMLSSGMTGRTGLPLAAQQLQQQELDQHQQQQCWPQHLKPLQILQQQQQHQQHMSLGPRLRMKMGRHLAQAAASAALQSGAAAQSLSTKRRRPLALSNQQHKMRAGQSTG